jgi:hypothetical protein
LWVSLMSFAAITLCVASQWVFIVVISLSTQSGNFWLHPRMWEWRYSSTDSYLSTRWRWVANSLYPWGKSPWSPLDRRLGRPQSRSERGGEEENIPSLHLQDVNPFWHCLLLSWRVDLAMNVQPVSPHTHTHTHTHTEREREREKTLRVL